MQYPGIADAVRADLRNVGALDRLLGLLFPAQEKRALFAELELRLIEECDYRVEARNQAHFHSLYSSRSDVVVPALHLELCTERILVSDFVDGAPFARFVDASTQAQRDAAGETLFRVAWESILRHGVFNADPHPGNFLFQDGRVVLLDFGCIARYSPQALERWRRIFRANLEDDRHTVRSILEDMGVVRDPQHYDFAYDREMTHALYEPWLYAEPFRFGPDYVSNTWRKMILDNKNKFRTSMPRDYILANRLQWGLSAVLALLGAQADWRGIILELLYAPGETRPPPFTRPLRRA